MEIKKEFLKIEKERFILRQPTTEADWKIEVEVILFCWDLFVQSGLQMISDIRWGYILQPA